MPLFVCKPRLQTRMLLKYLQGHMEILNYFFSEANSEGEIQSRWTRVYKPCEKKAGANDRGCITKKNGELFF